MSTRPAVQTPARAAKLPELSQSEHQQLFDQLMSGQDSPFFEKEEFAAFAVQLIGMEIEARRERLVLERGPVSIEERFAKMLKSCRTRYAREDLLRFIKRNEPRMPRMPRGRRASAHERWPLIQQVFFVYPKGTAKLTQSSRRDRGRGRDTASHFEATVKVALNIAGDRIEDVHAECLAAVHALRNK